METIIIARKGGAEMAIKDYLIMSGNHTVAKWENGILTVLNESLLPLYLRRISNADLWLETRAIDSHRTNSRLLKKALRLKEKDNLSTVMHINGATITDNYWIKPLDSGLCYDDVKFSDDYFSKLALKGTYGNFNEAARRGDTKTPELTNVGSFEKCWKLKDGRWWLIKTATHAEQFSELFTCKFGEALGMNMAVYERGSNCTKSLDFTDSASVNFEPASAFMGDNEDYEDVAEKLEEICPQAIPDYVRMIFLDTILVNPDRHTVNFGLLRDVETGELLGLAPIFDHNMSLISMGYPNLPKKSDVLIGCFNALLSDRPEYRKFLPKVSEEIIRSTLDGLHMRVRKKYITELIMSRYKMIDI